MPFAPSRPRSRSLPLIAVVAGALLLTGCDASTGGEGADPSTSASPGEFPLPELDPALVYTWDQVDNSSSVTAGSQVVADHLYAWAEGLGGDVDLYARVPEKTDEHIVMDSLKPLTPDTYRPVQRIERDLEQRAVGEHPVSDVRTGHTQPNYYGGEIVIDADGDQWAVDVTVRVVPKAGYLPGFGAYDGTDVSYSEAPYLVAGCDTHTYNPDGMDPQVVEFACEETTAPDGGQALIVTETRYGTDEPGSLAPAWTSVVHYRADGTAVVVRGKFGSIGDGSVRAPAGTPLDLPTEDLTALAFSVPMVAVE